VDYQQYLLPPETFREGESWLSLRAQLRHHMNDGNWYQTTALVNMVVSKMEDRMGKSGNARKSVGSLDSFHFVNVPVSAEDWELVVQEFSEVEAVLASVGEFVAVGYKLSFSLNGQNQLTVCSLTDKREGSSTYGACLTGGADGWYDALRVVLYKFHCVLKGDLANAQSGVGSTIRIQ